MASALASRVGVAVPHHRHAAAPRPRPCVAARVAQEAAPAVSASGSGSSGSSSFVVMNVFKVKEQSYADFENVWKTRESHLKEMPGFVRFAMLKCTNVPGKYVSQTCWRSKADFENWTKSSQFQASHGGGKASGGADQQQQQGGSKRPNTMSMLEGPPAPELYETVTVTEW